jgi:hypothetical protein
MKIVYIAKFNRMWDELAISLALGRNGVKVVEIEDSAHSNSEYLKIIEKENPDYVMFAKANVKENGAELIKELKIKGRKTLSWTFDLYLGYPPRQSLSRFHFFKCDYVFLTDGGRIDEYRKRGINAYLLRQGIPDIYNYMGEFDKKDDYDVVFVGCDNKFFPYRKRTAEFLSKTYGNRFKWFGKRDTNEIRGNELNKLYATAKIVIGDSVYSPNYWSNRIYETLGRGGFLIHAKIPGIEKEFEEGKEFITYNFNDYKKLKELIDYYLKHDDERNKIRMAGFEKISRNYTFDHRVKELLNVLRTAHN